MALFHLSAFYDRYIFCSIFQPVKKSVVMSGDALKEMQKQMKANRDERRLTVS